MANKNMDCMKKIMLAKDLASVLKWGTNASQSSLNLIFKTEEILRFSCIDLISHLEEQEQLEI